MNQSTEPLRKKLADFIHTASFEHLTAEVIHREKLCLLDLIGVSIAGSHQGVSAIVRRNRALYLPWAIEEERET